MGRLLKNLLNGARQVLVLYPEGEYQRPKRGDFSGDITALRGDSARIGNDLKKGTLWVTY